MSPGDFDLVNRVASRLDAAGPETLYLRTKLLLALIGAAELAGDKAEAREYARQHAELCRARASAGGR